MMSEVSSIVRNLEKNAMQGTMTNRNVNIEYSNKNYNIAYYIYNFLVGKSNKLLSYEYVDKVVHSVLESNNDEMNVISVGCGIVVFLRKLNDKFDVLIEFETPINESQVRIDLISNEEYIAFNKVKGTQSNINVDENPIFDKNRVNKIQKYLNNYLSNCNLNTNSKTK